MKSMRRKDAVQPEVTVTVGVKGHDITAAVLAEVAVLDTEIACIHQLVNAFNNVQQRLSRERHSPPAPSFPSSSSVGVFCHPRCYETAAGDEDNQDDVLMQYTNP